MKKSFIMMSIAVVVAIFFLSACGGGGGNGLCGPSDEGTTSPVDLGVIDPSVSYDGRVGQLSATTGASSYFFLTSTSAQYTIGLTNTTTNLWWQLRDSGAALVLTCNNVTTGPGDEICTTPANLAGSAFYALYVYNSDGCGSFFTIAVSRP